MKTLTIASRKGGAGKTTLAAHLAVQAELEGVSVLLVDRDIQGSLSWWWRLREGDTPALVAADVDVTVPEVLAAAAADGVELVIVDTPPHADVEIVEAVRASDLTLIPCRPGPFDLAAVGATLELVQALKKPLLAVLTACPPGLGGVGEPGPVREARTVLSGMGFEVASATVGQRAAMAHAITSGQAVSEFDAESKASREIRRLWNEIRERI